LSKGAEDGIRNRSIVIKRLGYEAPAGWTTYDTSLDDFSLFQGVARGMNDSYEKQQ